MLRTLEARMKVDLISVAESFSGWPGEHPGAEVMLRDGDGLFAEGGGRGAPGAV